MTNMSNASFPLLSLIIFMPLLGALAVALTRNIRLAKNLALLFATLELIATGIVVWCFNSEGNGFQWVEDYEWIPSLNIGYLIGVDGISVLFLPMSALLTLMAIVA